MKRIMIGLLLVLTLLFAAVGGAFAHTLDVVIGSGTSKMVDGGSVSVTGIGTWTSGISGTVTAATATLAVIGTDTGHVSAVPSGTAVSLTVTGVGTTTISTTGVDVYVTAIGTK